MGSKTVFYTFDSDKPIEIVKDALKRSMMFLGGTMQDLGQMITITQGNNGVGNAFTAELNANVNLRCVSEKKYEVFCTIEWKPSSIVWICLVVGFFVFGILWIIPLLYLFVDPTTAYQQALYRVPSLLQ
jgi:hypothetical protein